MWLRNGSDRRRQVRRLSAFLALVGWICAFELVPGMALGQSGAPRAVAPADGAEPAPPIAPQRPLDQHDAYNIAHHRAALLPVPVWHAPLVLQHVEPVDQPAEDPPRPASATHPTAQPRAPPSPASRSQLLRRGITQEGHHGSHQS